MLHLMKQDRIVDVLQSMRSQGDEAEVSTRVADQLTGGIGYHDLPTVCRGADPRRVVHGESDVVVVDDRRVPGVDPDAHPNPATFRP